MLELDLALHLWDRFCCRLDDTRLGVDQSEHTLAGRKPLLELAPEGRDAGEWEQEDPKPLHEQIPVTGRHGTIEHTQATEIDHGSGADTCDDIKHRKDAAEHETAVQVEAIRTLVDGHEVLIQRAFLAETLSRR